MKIKCPKGTFETFIIFLLSPFLSIPFLLLQFKRKDRWASVMFSFLVGIIAYLYIPAVSNDKAKYYIRYEFYKNLSLSDFYNFLVSLKKPDFIFDFILFAARKYNIRLEFVFFALTFLCVYLLFNIINSIIEQTQSKSYNYLLVSVLTFFSFSLPSLYSGLRFTLGASILVFGIYQLLFLKNKVIGIILIIIATQTHFSLLYFIPALAIFSFDKFEKVDYRLFFLLSLLFLLIPTSVTSSIFSFMSLSESLDAKTSVYVDGKDAVSQNFDSNQSSKILYILRTAWYYMMLIILIFYHKKLIFNDWSKKFIYLLYIFIFFVNFTYSFTTVFSRFSIVIKLLFLLYIVYLYLNINTVFTKKVFYLILFFYALTFLIDVYILRINFMKSLFSSDNLLIIQIINKKINYNEFIK